MGWTFDFLDNGILEINVKGVFTIDDFRELIQQMISDNRWKPGLNKLFNGKDLDIKILNTNTLYNIGKIQQEFSEEIGGGKLAILVQDAMDYGTGVSYKNIVDKSVESRVMIFLNYDKAIEWLKTPIDTH